MIGLILSRRASLAVLSFLAAVGLAAVAQAQGDSSTDHNQPADHDHHQYQCYEANGNPAWCNRLDYCWYDQRSDQCIDRGGGDPGGRECSAYDRDPQTCNDQQECRYDYNWQRCVDNQDPGPGPGQQCWQIQNQFQCDRTPGCYFDRQYNQCRDQGGGGRVETTYLNCQSWQYRYNRCQAPGRIVAAQLTRQESNQPCYEGQSWGYDNDAVWVNAGCRGSFLVQYYPRF